MNRNNDTVAALMWRRRRYLWANSLDISPPTRCLPPAVSNSWSWWAFRNALLIKSDPPNNLIVFLTCAVPLACDGEDRNVTPCYNQSGRLKLAPATSLRISCYLFPKVTLQTGPIVPPLLQQHKDTSVKLLLKRSPLDKFTWWIFNVPGLSTDDR